MKGRKNWRLELELVAFKIGGSDTHGIPSLSDGCCQSMENSDMLYLCHLSLPSGTYCKEAVF